ncbi:NAD(P)-binding protein, partial [Streptomyces sp. NPDC020667]|uniref:NAD(P)-binding protein n=1 Tax=Streptomyces sp. NPDC020667 TaxID=3154895 RepID=UPI0034042CB6
MRELRAVVIGGGIGGLTAAAALHHRGWTVTVLERAASLEPVGAGIALAANALRALDTFGAGGAPPGRGRGAAAGGGGGGAGGPPAGPRRGPPAHGGVRPRPAGPRACFDIRL